jgi:Aspartyl protease
MHSLAEQFQAHLRNMKKHLLGFILLLAAFGAVQANTNVAFDPSPPAKSKVRVPFVMDRNLIIIEAQVGEGPVSKFIFDTGTQGFVLRDTQADAWGLKGEGFAEMGRPGDPNPFKVRNISVPELTVEGLKLREVAGIAAGEELFLPPGAVGIIGMKVFEGYLVTIDYAKSMLIISKGELQTNGPGVIPINLAEIVEGKIKVNGQEMLAFFDSGGPEALSFPLEWQSQLKLKAEPERYARARTGSGEVDLYRAQLLGEIQIGSIKLTDPAITLVSGGFPGINIGFPFLRNYAVTIDMQHGLLRLTAPKKR